MKTLGIDALRQYLINELQTVLGGADPRHYKLIVDYMTRLGFISKNASNDELVYYARELNPEYPGVFDLSVWQIGRNWCHPKKPDCGNCYLNKYCPKTL